MTREGARKSRAGGGDASPPGRGATVRAALLRAVVFAALWWVLTDGGGGVLFAAVLVPLAVAASLALLPAGASGVSPWGLLRFVPFFLWASLRGGIDVARRTLDPRMPIAPALREFELRAHGDRERVLVAAVLSLMPGSVSVAVEGARLRLHVLDHRLPIERTVRDVERRVAAVFGRVPRRQIRRGGRA